MPEASHTSFQRSAGILLHPSSLPGPYGIGDLGQAAYQWLDFLKEADQKLWQVLPLGPTGYGDSPYQCFSAFAGNPYLISLDKLLDDRLLADVDIVYPDLSEDKVDFGAMIPWKLSLLESSFKRFSKASEALKEEFQQFCLEKASWLEHYALFMALKEYHGGVAWNAWPKAFRDRDETALTAWQVTHSQTIEKYKYYQWLFFRQWLELKAYAHSLDIQIIGDIPIFIAYDSADTWANPSLFYLDSKGNPTVVAGVPPDYFSATGQRWGNPLYRWERMQAQGFQWWIDRFTATYELVDIVRLDHFRGFEAYWEIPASEATAVKGRWLKGPGQALFDALRSAFGDKLAIIAEDLGVITPEVEALRDNNGFPGMKVLQFAFGSDASDPYLPHNYSPNSVVYSGTHDNDTSLGWYSQTPEVEKDFARRYLARDGSDIAWDLIRLAYASPAVFSIVPLQDVLRLDSSARMNTPGSAANNWSWRFRFEDIGYWLAPNLADITEVYGRSSKVLEVKDTAYRQSVLPEVLS